MITKEQVIKAQNQWAKTIIKLSSIKENNACKKLTIEFLNELYYFEIGPVLFKPTMAKFQQFRNTKEKTLSYFIGGDNRQCREDDGFALAKWKNVSFENIQIKIIDNLGFAIGNCYFENESTKIKAEFSFGYREVNKSMKIFLHHSSIPYKK